MRVAPILLFTYKRLDTLRKTVDDLKNNYLALESDLYIFSDAAKTDIDVPIVLEVRKFLKSISGFKTVTVIEAPINKGLASSIIEGVSFVFNKADTLIVLEDDLSTTPNFLMFMNACLSRYENNPSAFSISGYSFNLGVRSGTEQDAYFLNRGWSWGWATWKDRWEKVDWDVNDYSSFVNDNRARREFAKGGSDLNAMLDKQISGQLDSWAIRWFYHQFRIKGLTIYPVFSKVFNNGFDQFATHTNGSKRRYLPNLDKNHDMEFDLPNSVKEDYFYQKRFNSKMGVFSRIISKVETAVLKIFR